MGSYFFAELKEYRLNENGDFHFSSNEGVLKWFDKSEVKTLEMPFTAKFVINHYLDIGMYDDKMYGGIANGDTVVFNELPEA